MPQRSPPNACGRVAPAAFGPQLKRGSFVRRQPLDASSSATTMGSCVRKQYYFRRSSRGLLAWDIERLVQLSSTLPRKQIPLSNIRELEEVWYGDDELPTWRAMIEHMTLIDEADLSFPIILSSDGAVMDGMHRVAKAVREGRTEIGAVQFDHDPEPDHVGLGPKDLPY